MRLTPEVLPMLQLCSCQLTLLTSLAFGAVLAVFSAPLTAQTTQNSPGIPNLSRYDSETRGTMELACVSEKTRGPVVYGACLNRQIASLRNSPGIPNLSGYDSETQRTMELACVSEKTRGPVVYGACLNRQIASLQKSPERAVADQRGSLRNSPGIPNSSGYDNETRGMIELACSAQVIRGPAAYRECLNEQVASLQNSPGIPNLSGYDKETRGMIELACSAQVIRGPAAYRECLNEQVASLRRYESERRRKTSPASKSGGTRGNSATAQ